MVKMSPHPQGLPRGGQRERPARAVGLRGRPRVPDEGRRARAWSIGSTASTTNASTTPSARRSRTASNRRSGSSTSPSASISTSSSGRPRRSRAGASAHPVVDEALPAGPRTSPPRPTRCSSSTCTWSSSTRLDAPTRPDGSTRPFVRVAPRRARARRSPSGGVTGDGAGPAGPRAGASPPEGAGVRRRSCRHRRPGAAPKAEAFQVLRQLAELRAAQGDGVALKYDTHLDFYVADSAVECHRDHLEVDDYHVKVLTMKEPPAKTFAHILQDLYGVPSPFIACLEWQRLPNAHDAPRPPRAPAALLQQERVAGQLPQLADASPRRCSSTIRRRRPSTSSGRA